MDGERDASVDRRQAVLERVSRALDGVRGFLDSRSAEEADAARREVHTAAVRLHEQHADESANRGDRDAALRARERLERERDRAAGS